MSLDARLRPFFANAVAQTARRPITHVMVGGNASCKTTYAENAFARNDIDLSKMVNANFDAIRTALLGKGVSFRDLSLQQCLELNRLQVSVLDYAFENKADVYYETFDYDSLIMDRQDQYPERELHVRVFLTDRDAAWKRMLARQAGDVKPSHSRKIFDDTHDKAYQSIGRYASRANRLAIFDTSDGQFSPLIYAYDQEVNMHNEAGLARHGLQSSVNGNYLVPHYAARIV